MVVKTKEATTSKNGKNAVDTKNVSPAINGATSKKEEIKKLEIAKATETVKQILSPSAKTRLNRLETLNILADKFNSVSSKYDELTHFMAGNDNTNAQMKFSSASNYSFTLRNPAIIDKILGFVEAEFSQIVERAEKEVLEYQV